MKCDEDKRTYIVRKTSVHCNEIIMNCEWDKKEKKKRIEVCSVV